MDITPQQYVEENLAEGRSLDQIDELMVIVIRAAGRTGEKKLVFWATKVLQETNNRR